MVVRESGTGFAIGFIVGAAIGVTIGFLYAPQSGKETRELLKAKAGAVREKVAEVVDKTREASTEAGKAAEAKLEEVKKQTR